MSGRRPFLVLAVLSVMGWSFAVLGAVNLIPNGDFNQGVKSWFDWSKGSGRFTVTANVGKDNSPAARLEAAVENSRPVGSGDTAILATSRFPVAAGAAYVLRGNLRGSAPTLTFRLVFEKKKGEAGAAPPMLWGDTRPDPKNWNSFSYTFVTPPEMGTGGLCYITFFVKQGLVWLDDLTVSPAEGNAARTLTWNKQPLVTDQPPPEEFVFLPSDGPAVFFLGDEPGGRWDIAHPGSGPQRGQLVSSLNAFAARGDRFRLWFGFVSRHDLSSPAIRLARLVSAEGTELTISNIRVYRIRCWPQKFGRVGSRYYVIPELMERLSLQDGKYIFSSLEFDESVLAWKTGETAVARGRNPERIWLECELPGSAPPGVYQGTVYLSARNLAEQALPFTVRVLPFALPRPDPGRRTWMMQADTQRWRSDTADEQISRELALLKNAGYDGLNYRGVWNPVIKDGRIAGIDDGLWERHISLIKKAGLAGPVAVSQQRLPETVARWLRIPVDAAKPDTWTPALREGMAAILATVNRVFVRNSLAWYLYPEDEIHGTEEQKKARLFLPALKEIAPEVPITVTTDVTLAGELGKYIDLPIYNPRFCVWTEETNKQAREYTASGGKPFWWYGSGDYGSQEGNLAVNRYLSGALFWKSGASGHLSWSLQRSSGPSIWNDFDGTAKDVAIIYPALKEGEFFTETLQWKGLEEGIRDAWYLNALEAAITENSASRDQVRRERAAAVRKEFDAKMQMIPWHQEIFVIPVTNGQLEGLRWWAALRIAELRGVPVPDAPRTGRPSLAIVPRPGRQADNVVPPKVFVNPVLYAQLMPANPRIDGNLDPELKKSGRPLELHAAAEYGPAPATRVFLGYNQEYLYLGFECAEPFVGNLKENAKTSADKVWRDDSVEVFLDYDFSQESYYHCIVNSLGTVWEMAHSGAAAGRTVRLCEAAVAKGAAGWKAEIAIPLARLRKMPPGLCGLALVRNRWADEKGRKSTAQMYCFPPGEQVFHDPGEFGPLAFLNDEFRLVSVEAAPAHLGGGNRFEALIETSGVVAPPALKPYASEDGATITGVDRKEVSGRTKVAVSYELTKPGTYRIGLFLGERQNQYAGICPSVLQSLRGPLYNKKMYTSDDRAVDFDYELPQAEDYLRKVRVVARLEQDGRILAASEPKAVESTALSVRTDMGALTRGRYSLIVGLVDASSGCPVDECRAEFECEPGI